MQQIFADTAQNTTNRLLSSQPPLTQQAPILCSNMLMSTRNCLMHITTTDQLAFKYTHTAIISPPVLHPDVYSNKTGL